MTIVVTGAAGLVGSNIIRALNRRKETGIIAVDDLTEGDKFKNLVSHRIEHYLDQTDFLDNLLEGYYEGQIAAIIHQGACSDTMEKNGKYMMENNYQYTLLLFEYCQSERIPFLYASSASVYGLGKQGFDEISGNQAPLNVYGYSKLLFDETVQNRAQELTAQVVGLRYFNVYGIPEWHKGRMASIIFQLFKQYCESGRVVLFEGSEGYPNGGQMRDFVSVEDVANIGLWFLDHPDISGIFNVGSGHASSFNDVAMATVNALRAEQGLASLTLSGLVAEGIIQYTPFPDAIKGKYQSYTKADISRLRTAGYSAPMQTIEEGVRRYVQALLAEQSL